MIPDHELFLLKNGIFLDTIGYWSNDIHGILTYTPDIIGNKNINGKTYRKRFLKNDENNKIYLPSNFEPSFCDTYCFKIPIDFVEKRFDSKKGYAIIKNSGLFGNLCESIEERLGNSNLGITGSVLAGCNNPQDIDLLVYGIEEFRNLLHEKESRNIQNKIKSKTFFYPLVTSHSLELIYLNKSKYKFDICGFEVSLWARYTKPLEFDIQLTGKVVKQFLIIESDEHSFFSPVIYGCNKGIMLISYDRLLKGALTLGQKLHVTGEKVRINIDRIEHDGVLFRHNCALELV